MKKWMKYIICRIKVKNKNFIQLIVKYMKNLLKLHKINQKQIVKYYINIQMTKIKRIYKIENLIELF